MLRVCVFFGGYVSVLVYGVCLFCSGQDVSSLFSCIYRRGCVFYPGQGWLLFVFLFFCLFVLILLLLCLPLTSYHLPLNTYLLLTTYYLLLTYSLFIISTCLILFFVFTITHTHTTKHLLECYTKKPNSCWLNVRVLDCETLARMRVCARVVWG